MQIQVASTFNDLFLNELKDLTESSMNSKSKVEHMMTHPLAQESGGKNFTSVPSRRIPCKARSLASTHDSDNAFFDVPVKAPHGLLLCCSHPECAGSGRRFRYCQVCELPVAKRNFLKRHGHGLIETSKELKEDVDQVCGVILSSQEGPTQLTPDIVQRSVPHHRRSATFNGSSNVTAFDFGSVKESQELTAFHIGGITLEEQSQKKRHRRRYMSFDASSNDLPQRPGTTNDIKANDGSFLSLSDSEKKWLTLLRQRPELEDQSGMSNWMDKVLTLSEDKRLELTSNMTVSAPPAIDPLLLLDSTPDLAFNPDMEYSSPLPSFSQLPSLPENKAAVLPKPETIGDHLGTNGVLMCDAGLPPPFDVIPPSPPMTPALASVVDMDLDEMSHLKGLAPSVQELNDVGMHVQTSATHLVSMSDLDFETLTSGGICQEETVLTEEELALMIGEMPSVAMSTN